VKHVTFKTFIEFHLKDMVAYPLGTDLAWSMHDYTYIS